MSNINTEIFKALSLGQSIDEIICLELQEALNLLLKSELTSFLDYEPHDPIGYNSGNSRNGSYKRKLKTKYGEIEINMPRDRNGEFQQETIASYRRRTNDLETTILQLYSKGITTSEIADLIEKMYGHAYTPATISNITKAIQENVDAFHKRKVASRYVALFCDATMLNVRRDSVSKEALHIVVGITPEGYKEVLDYRLYPQEASSNYRDILFDLKERGCKEVLLIVTDGLTGIEDACLEVFPKAQHQSCWVHVQCNIAKLVRAKDRKNIMEQVKPLYQSNTKETAEIAFTELKLEIGKTYPKVIQMLERNRSLYSFYNFPKEIQRSIYTTNLIEGLNKQLKRQTKKKEQFPNEESLERFVCDYMMNYNSKFTVRIHKGFNVVQSEILELFETVYQ